MKLASARRPAVIATAAVTALALGASGTAVARDLITSGDIQNNTIRSADVKNNNLRGKDIRDGSIRAADIRTGAVNTDEVLNGSLLLKDFSDSAVKGIQNGVFVGENWGVLLRNTTATATSILRSGPASGPSVRPPVGTGSVQLLVPTNTQITFGNEVDFVGQSLVNTLGNTVGFSVYATGEDLARNAGNVPNIKIEIDPNLDPAQSASNYGTLNFVPSRTATANAWTTYDATSASDGKWFVTGGAGTAAGCTLASQCSWSEIRTKFANATILTVGVGKGSDGFDFQGAVDALRIGNTVYDFEARGVFARNA